MLWLGRDELTEKYIPYFAIQVSFGMSVMGISEKKLVVM